MVVLIQLDFRSDLIGWPVALVNLSMFPPSWADRLVLGKAYLTKSVCLIAGERKLP